jgi:hypothetical protein
MLRDDTIINGFKHPSIAKQFGIVERMYQEWWFFEFRDDENDIQFFSNCSINNPANVSGGFPCCCDFISAVIVKDKPIMTSKQTDCMDKFECSTKILDVNLGDRIFITSLDKDRIRFRGFDPTMNVSFDLVYSKNLPSWNLQHLKMGNRPVIDRMWYLPIMVSATVTGTITIEGKEYRVNQCTGYHDQWFGSPTQFRWSPWVNVNCKDFEIVSNNVSKTNGFSGLCIGDKWVSLGTPKLTILKEGIEKNLKNFKYPSMFSIVAKNKDYIVKMTLDEAGSHAFFDAGMESYVCHLVWSWNYRASGIIMERKNTDWIVIKSFNDVKSSVYYADNFDFLKLAKHL